MGRAKKTLPKTILEGTTSDAVELVKNIDNLTVEDVVVLYAYAEAIVETVREPLIILDKNLHVKTANKAFFEMFKVTKKDTYNKSIFDLGNGQWNIPSLKTLLKEILPKNTFFNDYEVAHNFKNIGERIMMLNARRIILEGHKTELILLAVEDVTLRKQIDKQKDDFIGVASHELKTPMTSIKSFVQILQGYNAKTKDKKNIYLLDRVSQEVRRMERMITSFLNVYTIQSGKMELHKTHFKLDDLLKEVIGSFSLTSDTHTLERKGTTSAFVYADEVRIRQVLINLLTNAIKYSPKAGKITIKVKQDEKFVTVSVQDYGMGIPQDKKDHVFDRFYRVKEKIEKNIPGLGLGLYIAYEVVKEHKGKMWVDSIEGKGSTFYFSLPLSKKTK